jgi:hypothetical protein
MKSDQPMSSADLFWASRASTRRTRTKIITAIAAVATAEIASSTTRATYGSPKRPAIAHSPRNRRTASWPATSRVTDVAVMTCAAVLAIGVRGISGLARDISISR